jgi:hypothetical protein|tara:strand:- start:2645 stop:3022 length:378 start_codon:yes stop_codon:yes gene_type:complete
MALANSLQKVANKAITKFGGDVTIQSVSLGTYNSATGAAIETIITKTVKGILEDVKATELRKPSTVENRQIRSDDKKLTIAALNLSSAPSLQDKIVINNITYGIIAIETIEQANVAIAYELILRG